MSKFLKELQLKHLKRQFDSVDDLLFVNVVGIDANETNEFRLKLREKEMSVEVVPNRLTRILLKERGVDGVDDLLKGPSAIAWGGPGIVELAKEISDWAKKLENLSIKGGCVSGQTLDAGGVEKLSKLPSREELLGRIVMLAQAPFANVAMLAMSPHGRLAGQVKAIADGGE